MTRTLAAGWTANTAQAAVVAVSTIDWVALVVDDRMRTLLRTAARRLRRLGACVAASPRPRSRR